MLLQIWDGLMPKLMLKKYNFKLKINVERISNRKK